MEFFIIKRFVNRPVGFSLNSWAFNFCLTFLGHLTQYNVLVV